MFGGLPEPGVMRRMCVDHAVQKTDEHLHPLLRIS